MKIIKLILTAFIFSGFSLLILTAGGSDAGMFCTNQAVCRCIIAAAVTAAGFLGFLIIQVIETRRSN